MFGLLLLLSIQAVTRRKILRACDYSGYQQHVMRHRVMMYRTFAI